MLKNYIKIAWRNLLKYKGYSLINILGLAVGIAVCVLIFRFVTHELSYDTFHANSDRIFRVTLQTPQVHLALTPSLVSPVFQQNFPEIQDGVRVYDYGGFRSVVIRHGNNVFEESSFGFADSSFFDVFSFEVLAGNPNTALSRPYTMVISRSQALKYFGNENPVGKTLVVDNQREYEITAVIDDMPTNSHFRFDFVASLMSRRNWSELSDQELKGSQFYTYVMLREGVSPEELENKISALVEKNYSSGDFDFSLHLQPLTDIYLYSDLEAEIQSQGDIRYVWAASAIALLILAIACINYMNLATARSARRAREVGIRKVLGSDRRYLVGQFYGESAFLVGLALLLALFFVELFLPWFNQMTGKSLTPGYGSPGLWIAFGLIGVVVTVLAGSYPAFMLSGYKPAAVLKGNKTTGGGAQLRKTLVVFQFAVSVFLIIGTLVIFRQVEFIRDKELGYKKDNVIALTSYSEVEKSFEAFKSGLMQVPGIENATMASDTPVDIGAGYNIDIEGIDEDPNLIIRGLRAYSDFNQTLDIDVVAGRDLRPGDITAANPPEEGAEREYAFLLNEAAVETFEVEPEEIIGRRVTMHGRSGTVVGVIEDFHFVPLHKKIEPLVVFPSLGYNKLLVGFSTNDVSRTLAKTREVWEAMFPSYPFEYEFLDQEYDALYRQEQRAGSIFTSFAALAIFVACLGLFGLVSYTVEQRTREIGVRKVLGATVSNIVGLFSRDFIVLVLVGFVLAIPVSWYVMEQWLQNFAYRIDIHFSILIVAGLITLLIALLTVSYQAVKAAGMNPVNSLKSE